MKKIIFGMCLVTFLVIGLADQSWAMGKRGSRGGHFGSNSGDSNYSGFGSNNFSDNNSFHNYSFGNNNNEEENEGGPSQRNGFFTENTTNTEHNGEEDCFPASATVPEPATLALMGMGLTGILLRRKKK